MQPSMMRPSPSGPFWCAQRFVTAPICLPSRNTAMRSPPGADTMVAHVSGMESRRTDNQPSVRCVLHCVVAPLAPAGGEMQRGHEQQRAAEQDRHDGTAIVLHGAERDMHHGEAVGDIERHMQRLPDPRRQKDQPEIMTGRGEQKQDQQRGKAQHLERKADEFSVIGPFGEFGHEGSAAHSARCTIRS